MEATPSRVPLVAERAFGRSNPLLRLTADERLVARVRAGSEPAFAELYERYYKRILSFCRHMLGSQEEGEDAVQQTFINAYRDMLRSDKELRFRPWLYRIARNQSLSMLRARRQEAELTEAQPSVVGLSEEVAGRGDLRDLLHDLRQLPTDQREALVLAELNDNSHVEVAEIIGCDKEKVKSLVFQARTSLIKSREAREVSCEEIRQQLGILRGGSLRRNVIRRHLKGCEGCRAFQREVKRQRQALAIILPVIPSAALKFGAGTAMAAVGAKTAGAVGGAVTAGSTAGGAAAGGASAAGGAAAGGAAGGAAASGPFAAVAAKLGVSAVAVKGVAATATVTAVVAGGTVGENVTRDLVRDTKSPASQSSGKGGQGSAGKGGQGPGGAAAGAPGAASGKKAKKDSKSDRAKRSRRKRRRLKEERRAERRRDKRARDRQRGGQGQGGDRPPSSSRPSPGPKSSNPSGGSPRRPPRKGSKRGAARPPAKKKAGKRRPAPGVKKPRRGGAKQRGTTGGKKPPARADGSTSANGSTLRSAVPRR